MHDTERDHDNVTNKSTTNALLKVCIENDI